jgi:hypothetical protein
MRRAEQYDAAYGRPGSHGREDVSWGARHVTIEPSDEVVSPSDEEILKRIDGSMISA